MNPYQPHHSGLCATCNSATTCMYVARQRTPIWHCQEFDDGPRKRVVLDLEPVTDPPSAAVRPGLCANCHHVATCLLPKRISGVWHCEEYM